MHATMDILSEKVFSNWFVQRGYKKDDLIKNYSVGREPPFIEELSPEQED
jgi:hypothetical protein